MSSPSAHELAPRVSGAVPILASAAAYSNDYDEKSDADGTSTAESVRVFHPDEVIQKQPSTIAAPPNPLKSSLKNGSLVNGMPVALAKAEDKSPREAARGNPGAAKGNATAHSLSADSRRGHHQRFPSTGLSLPSGSTPVLDPKTSYTEKRTSSQQYPLKPSSLAPSSTIGPTPGNPGMAGYGSSHSKGHRRQPSVGREQRQVSFCPYDGYCFVLDETRCAICMEERGSLPAPVNGNGQPWKKVLYEKQGYEDNYTDRDTFLAELKKNGMHTPSS